MDNRKEIETYVIQRVSFGDRPSGTITTVALRKTAEMEHVKYPQAVSYTHLTLPTSDLV